MQWNPFINLTDSNIWKWQLAAVCSSYCVLLQTEWPYLKVLFLCCHHAYSSCLAIDVYCIRMWYVWRHRHVSDSLTLCVNDKIVSLGMWTNQSADNLLPVHRLRIDVNGSVPKMPFGVRIMNHGKQYHAKVWGVSYQ